MSFATLKITVFGESHGPAVGVTVEGFPAGIPIDEQSLQAFMARRKTQNAAFTTPRVEEDRPLFLSGVKNGYTTGAPLNATIYNADKRSGDYEAFRDVPRPSHADYVAGVKYKGFADLAGGGHFSGRLTAPLCVVGYLAETYLEKSGIFVGAYLSEAGGISAVSYLDGIPAKEEIEATQGKPVPVLRGVKQKEIEERLQSVRAEGDSVGGVIECVALGLPVGLGECGFRSMEGRIASAIFSVPATKGVEFGSGFLLTKMKGSEGNDPWTLSGGAVVPKTNHNGGINGGITNGAPLLVRVAVKPTPSIAKEQDSVNLKDMTPTKLTVGGRHDACIALRAVPVVEACVAIAIADALLEMQGQNF
ncbi:MAG: chorismate synthase [Clostridiales bacterium]|nr:chorismate synthase [Clostridiales bacterium]